ncbi:unnamed protein product [Leptosia nina]|uniref:Pupal cuticle protein 27 n=1 Tax=Leptosia nina TaxID=320188 RepID=A0AAV1JQA5_9NEOP
MHHSIETDPFNTLALSSASCAQLPTSYVPPKSSGQSATYLPPGPGSSRSLGFESNGNNRAQQAEEKAAAILRLDQEVGEEGFHYSYETANGIQAEEAGNAGQSRGGFSYKGDDGNTYSVTFTAGVGGFQPQGAHLPVPPPTPQEILLALQQNAKDEAAGIFDDGQYHEDSAGQNGQERGQNQKHGFGSTSRQGNFNSKSGYSY